MITIFLLITGAIAQEIPTPASLIGPRNFNYHPYQVQFLRETNVEPTKKGPVVFPNDAPPSPRTPLVVTSRPLIESILRSDLNPNPKTTPNTSIAEPSQINNVFNIPYPNQIFDQVDGKLPDSFNNIEYQASSYTGIPYNILNNQRLGLGRANEYHDYGEISALPPIYKALSDHAQQNLINLQNKNTYNNYQPKNLEYDYKNDENRNYDQNEKKNYAFSYTVKDHKTGDDFSHSQHSSGSATNGEYRVRLPDGRTQIVSYTADENGYNAKVRYNDETKDYYNINSNPGNFNNLDVNKNNPHNNLNRNDKTIPVKEDIDQYNSNEDYDYSAEYNNNYQPYKSKFNYQTPSTFAPTFRPTYEEIKDLYTKEPLYKPTFASTIRPTYEVPDLFTKAPNLTPAIATVRPSYEEIKDLFTKAPNLYLNDLSASNTQIKDSSTDGVVLIGNKNVFNNAKANNPVRTIVQSSFVATTPASYLASTIASLRDRIRSKTILSDSFMDRINKYLQFK